MKKYLSILCTIALLSTLCGCSNDSDIISSSESSNVSESTSETTVDEDIAEESSEFTTEPTAVKTTEAPTETSAIKTTIEAVSETPTEQSEILNSSDYVAKIGEVIEITDIITMQADSIGAIDGTSFVYNGNKFEVYRFDEGHSILSSATDGTVTITIAGWGEYSTNSSVNGCFIMIYNTIDDTVIQTFLNIN